jgi:hypothetical protein
MCSVTAPALDIIYLFNPCCRPDFVLLPNPDVVRVRGTSRLESIVIESNQWTVACHRRYVEKGGGSNFERR